ncbi:LRR receptor-like serine/threonine-protein kinase GSO1-like [Planoprotostelium fungivorum]|uniref:LRR receptor-like serine/threonine-protein kinase GSO1-like n=1 Tax=Planoprotostelium fungivorum TaxID=1890364 RepID=A0A2P6MRT2_9EUKA|nr:LRR receptor-like serine/threonine-protein kinase GSO1-like [Planoprotostelium fungivorum]
MSSLVAFILIYLSIVSALKTLDKRDQVSLNNILTAWGGTQNKGTFNLDWDTNDIKNACGWQDLLCDQNGRLIVFELRATGDDWTFPTTFGDFTSLNKLVLNDIGWRSNASIPSSLSKLTSLIELSISNSEHHVIHPISSPLPSLAQMTELIRLDLSNLQMDIRPIPSWLFQMKNLQRLDLQGNIINGTIDYSKLAASSLKTVHLQPSECPCPTWRDSSLLQRLPQMDIIIDGSCPTLTPLSQSGGLRDLVKQFESCLVDYPDDELLSDVCARDDERFQCDETGFVTSVQISGNGSCQGLPKIPASILQLQKLNRLVIYNASLDLNSTGPLTGLTLSHIQFNYNNFSGKIPGIFCNFSLSTLSLSHNHFTEVEDCLLSSDISLLDLSSNELSHALPQSFCQFRGKSIDVSHNRLNGSVPKCNFTREIEILNLADNELSGKFEFGEYVFRDLDLSHNRFDGELPENLWDTADRQVMKLSLHDNNFSGKIPEFNSSTTSLTDVILSDNHFSGVLPVIPTTLSLVIIDLRNNTLLRGTLPGDLMQHTSTLYVSGTSILCPREWMDREGSYGCTFSQETTSSTQTSTMGHKSSGGGGGMSRGALIGIIVGSVVGGIVLIAIIVFVIVRIMKRKHGYGELHMY